MRVKLFVALAFSSTIVLANFESSPNSMLINQKDISVRINVGAQIVDTPFEYITNRHIKLREVGKGKDFVDLIIEQVDQRYEVIGKNEIRIYKTPEREYIGSAEILIESPSPSISTIQNSSQMGVSARINAGDLNFSNLVIDGANLHNVDLASIDFNGVEIRNRSFLGGRIEIEARSLIATGFTTEGIRYRFKQCSNDACSLIQAQAPNSISVIQPQGAYLPLKSRNEIFSNEMEAEFIVSKSLISFVEAQSLEMLVSPSRILSNEVSQVGDEVKISIRFDPVGVRPGQNKIEFKSGQTTRYFSNFVVKKMPEIELIETNFGGLKFYKNEEGRQLILKGKNLENLTVRPVSDSMALYEVGGDKCNQRKFSVSFANGAREGEYDLILSGGINQTITISYTRSSTPFNINKFVKINNKCYANGSTTEYNSGDKVIIEFDGDTVPTIYGKQHLRLNLKYYNDNGELIKDVDVPFQGNLFDIEVGKGSGDDALSFSHEINTNAPPGDKGLITPWGSVVVEISHVADKYAIKSDLLKLRFRHHCVFRGTKADKWNIELSVPPALFVSSYDNHKLVGQFLPVSFGFGFVYQPRDDNGRLASVDYGIYIAGLNFASPSTKTLGLNYSENGINSESEKFIEPTDVSFLILGKLHPASWKYNREWSIPFGIGATAPFIDHDWKYYVVGGVSYSFGNIK